MIATTNLINKTISPINRILKFGSRISFLTYFVTTILIVSIFLIATQLGLELYVFLGVLALPLLWFMINYPRVWIYCIVLTFTVFFISDEAGLTPTSIMGGLFYNLFLICWFVHRLFIREVNPANSQNQSFIRSKIDLLVLLFYFLILFNSVVAYLNGVELFDWLSEYMLYSLLLYYFPIREYFDDEKSLITLLLMFCIAVLVLDFKMFHSYYTKLAQAIYAFQIGRSMSANQQIFTSSLIAGVTLMFYSKTTKGRLLAFAIAIFSAGAILLTFSRAFWASSMLMVFLLIFFLNYKQTLKLLLIIIVSAGLVVTTIYTFFPKQSKFITKYITNRFSSTTKGKADISVRSRLYEYNEVIKKIKESPIAGQGLRKKFSFYDPIGKATSTTQFIHNGYLNLAYRVGIPLAAVFYVAMLSFMLKGVTTAWKLRKYELTRAKKLFNNNKIPPEYSVKLYIGLAICSAFTICMLFITSAVTSSFLFRDGLMVAAFSIAFIGIAEKKFKQIQQNDINKPPLLQTKN